MPIPPFLFGLLLGGGAVVVFNKRKQIASALRKENLECAFCKTKDFATDVRDGIVATTESVAHKTKETIDKIKTSTKTRKEPCIEDMQKENE